MAATSSTATLETKKRLALAVIDFLQTCTTDGTLPPEEQENIEVATTCIADSFKVDPSDKAATAAAISSGQNLLKIYSVYENLKGRSTSTTSAGGSSAAEGRPSTPATASTAPSTATNAEAENLKSQGNAFLQAKDYAKAIDCYSRAIAISPTNPIYLSNRAAAYSATMQHELASQDAELAVAQDPKYTKAWSRLGLARFALGDAKGSMEAYEQGINAEGNGGSDTMKKGYETAKRRFEQLERENAAESSPAAATARSAGPGAGAGAGGAPGGMPDLGAMLGALGGGGGGMPDLNSLMQNPMMRQMAQQVMQNPDMLGSLMNNPRLREMAGQAGSGGGMPDLQSLMNDPSIAEMARNFMGGAGGAGGGRGAGGAPGV